MKFRSLLRRPDLSRLKPPTKNTALVTYKLANDLLFILLIFFTLAFIAEGIIPGLVSTSFSLLRFAVLIALTLALIFTVAPRAGIKLKKPLNKKMTALVIFVTALLFFNSLLKLSVYLNIFISLTAIFAGYYTYETISEEN
ncbi:MAG: hypothetical protein P4L62_00515 [Candidatus Pacebacteria bacterium]|nr:hypothetical protein [Candidatus Paceibacterota bacterium]MDR3582832.1 hypothetical protein [Candidatus Paceibacterota bacterium]